MTDRLPASPVSRIFTDGVIVHYNRRAGGGSVSLEGSLTRIQFGQSAVDDAERDKIRAGRRCRFALDEGAGATNGTVKVARLAFAE